MTLPAPNDRRKPTLGNAVLLERLVQNLVENGVRHNVPDGWVRPRRSLPAPLETVTSAWNSSPPEPGMPGRPWEMA
jgi:hypothetical protein